MTTERPIEFVEFAHLRCDVCGEPKDDRFNMHDPREHRDYSFCSSACVRSMETTLKVAQRLGMPLKNGRAGKDAW